MSLHLCQSSQVVSSALLVEAKAKTIKFTVKHLILVANQTSLWGRYIIRKSL